jgi:DNA polymerase-3 subunit beta
MKFSIQREVLQPVLAKARSVLTTKDIVPILKNFNITVDDLGLRVVATDLELSVIAKTSAAKCLEPGRAVFPGSKLIEIVSTCADDVVTVTIEDDSATVECAGATWSVGLPSNEDYPEVPDTEDAEVVFVVKESFKNALSKVKGAAAREGVRPALQMVDVSGGCVRASDGAIFRQVCVPELSELDLQIPVGAAEDLVKLLKGSEAEMVGIGETEDHLLFVLGADVFVVTKNNVEYPDMEESLLAPARQNKQALTVDRDQLLNGVRRVRVNADEDTKGVTLNLSQNSLILSARDKYGNTAQQELEAGYNSPEGSKDRSLAVNHINLIDALQVVDDSSVTLMLGNDTRQRKSPIFIEDGGTVVVLQPLKLDL